MNVRVRVVPQAGFWCVLLICLSCLTTQSASVALAWDANTEPDIAGYKIYYGSEHPFKVVDAGNLTSITLADLLEGLTYTFYATAYNTAGLESDPSQAITYTVPALAVPPSITSQPLAQSLIVGATLTLSVEASGTAPLAYQWFKNGTEIPGANSHSFSIPAVTADDAGSYSVRVSNAAGEAFSEPAMLTVMVPLAPSITSQPLGQALAVGDALTLFVEATGTAPLTYQWLKDGVAIGGAIHPTFSIPAVSLADEGNYAVRISNLIATVTSEPAVISVNSPPVITAQPVGQSVDEGASVRFSVSATGSEPMQYFWQKNGEPIPGATASIYELPSVDAAAAGTYTVVVSNSAGTVQSDPAILVVNFPPAITAGPVSQTVSVGKSATFSVSVTGSEVLRYQWRKDGLPLPDANLPSFSIASTELSDAGQYSVEVSNFLGVAESQAATLSVVSSPRFVNRGNGKVKKGETVTLQIETAGSESFEYQWLKDGEPIAGATSSTLEISSVDAEDAGTYTVTVSNSLGTVLAGPAELEVLDSAATLELVNAGGSLQLSGQGAPGETYLLQLATSMSSPYWVTLQQVTANEAGQFLVYLPYDPLDSAHFYRVLLWVE